MSATPYIYGLKYAALSACKTQNWSNCVQLLENNLYKTSAAYKQFKIIKNGYNIIQQAIIEGYLALLAVFIYSGFPVNTCIDLHVGATMINFAASHKQSAVVRQLLSHGADPNSKNILGFTPLHWSASNGDLSSVRALIKHGANINLQDFDGYTALHHAAAKGFISIVQYLVSKKCDRSIKAVSLFNSSGKTALDLARENNHIYIVIFLSMK